MIADPEYKIGCPRQLYTGDAVRQVKRQAINDTARKKRAVEG